MSRIESLIEELCPDGVRYKLLGEVGTFIRGSGLQKKDFVENGEPCVHYGQLYTYYRLAATETKSFVSAELFARLRKAEPTDLIIATTSENDEDVCKAVAWLGERPVAVSGDAYIFRHDLDPKYVSYYFASVLFQDQKLRAITGTKVKRVSGESMAKFRIPVPPVEVQREIVSILDEFTQLEAELEGELEAELDKRRQQYEYYRDDLLTCPEGGTWTTLGEVCTKVSSGGTPTSGKSQYYGGRIPWVRTQEVDFGTIHETGMTITEEGLANSSAKWIPEHSVIVAMYGATAAKVAINEIPVTTNQACCNLQIDPEMANYRYVFYWIANRYLELKSLGEGSQSNINSKKVKSFPIQLPPRDEQDRIVELLDKFDALVNDLSVGLPAELDARRKQYEYYRDWLLTFKELPA